MDDAIPRPVPGAASSVLPTIGYDRSEMVLRAVVNMLNGGRNRAAEAAIRQVLGREPRNARAYGLLATLRERAGNMPEALALHEQAILLAPTDQDLHSAYIFALDQSPDVTLEQAYRARRRFNDLVKV